MREEIQKVFIRVCQDSNFTFSGPDAAVFVGKLLVIAPLEVYGSFGDMDMMNNVASGNHPMSHKKE